MYEHDFREVPNSERASALRAVIDALEGADWNGCVPFLVRLGSYADRPLPRPQQLLAGVADPLADLLPPG
jgi:hypothetical protein